MIYVFHSKHIFMPFTNLWLSSKVEVDHVDNKVLHSRVRVRWRHHSVVDLSKLERQLLLLVAQGGDQSCRT